jgi:hypothetical protein
VAATDPFGLTPELWISSLLEHQNGYNLDRQMMALKKIEQESSEENATMRKLAEKSSRDSSSVRILTIITLIYLPCTAVSVGFIARDTAETNSA